MFWRRYKIDAYPDYAAYQKGRRIDPMQIAWTTDAHCIISMWQNDGEDNPLGYAKINFASPHGVYMHDTPGQASFSKSFRAEAQAAEGAKCASARGVAP